MYWVSFGVPVTEGQNVPGQEVTEGQTVPGFSETFCLNIFYLTSVVEPAVVASMIRIASR